jgi:twinkle protein
MSQDLTPKFLAERLAARAEEFVPKLLPNGKLVGDEWAVGSITGDAGDSLKIKLRGDRAGLYKDFASDQPGGDLLDLIAGVRGQGLRAAMKEACEFLEITRPQFSTRRKPQYSLPSKPETAMGLSVAPTVANWFAGRGIQPDTLKRFKIFADRDDTAIFPYLRDGQILHYKFRSVKDKKFWCSKDTEKCLFGWHALKPGARSVILTEGEMDCLAMAQYGFQALSIPYGGGGGGKQDWIESEWENLEQFDTIFLAMDADEAGNTATQDLVERLGRHRCRVVKLPHKDANDCLMKGIKREDIVFAIRESRTLDPKELRNAREFTQQVTERFHPVSKAAQGFLMPWLRVSETFLMEWGCTTIIAGYAGHGKSEVVGQLVLDAIRQNVRVCAASLEFRSAKWLQRLVRQASGNAAPSHSLISQSLDWIGQGLWAFDVYGAAKPDRILEVFGYAHRRYGVKFFVIDNWSKLGIADDDLAEQKRIISLITEFAVQYNVHVIVVNHLRKVEDDFSAANKLSVKGSGAIVDLADNVIMAWRNIPKESKVRGAEWFKLDDAKRNDILRQPDTTLTWVKHRNGDEDPRLPLYFNRATHTWQEGQGEPPHIYVIPNE